MTALWVVNFFYKGIKEATLAFLLVLYDKERVTSFQEAGLLGRIRRLSGLFGFKGAVDGCLGHL